MLRASSRRHEESVDLRTIMDGASDSGVPGGAALVAFAEAVVGREPAAIADVKIGRAHV